MTDKIQIGKNTWIRPNRGQAVPKYGTIYFSVANGLVEKERWTGALWDYNALNAGNFFPTHGTAFDAECLACEAAKAAIIKPVDPTPITYEQWVEAGKPDVWMFYINDTKPEESRPVSNTVPFYFATHKRWLTKESAKAWRDQWIKENGGEE